MVGSSLPYFGRLGSHSHWTRLRGALQHSTTTGTLPGSLKSFKLFFEFETHRVLQILYELNCQVKLR